MPRMGSDVADVSAMPPRYAASAVSGGDPIAGGMNARQERCGLRRRASRVLCEESLKDSLECVRLFPERADVGFKHDVPEPEQEFAEVCLG